MANSHPIYEYIFITKLLLDEKKNYFSGGAEIHLLHILETLKDKRILVIQKNIWTRKTESFSKEGKDYLLIPAKTDLEFELKLAFKLRHYSSKIIHFNYFGLDRFVFRKHSQIFSATFHGTGWDFPTSNFPSPYISDSWLVRIGATFNKVIMIWDQVNSIRKMDRIMSVDTSLMRFCQQFMNSHIFKIHTIFNFVDSQKFKPTKIRSSSSSLNILFPRNISYARGVTLLIPLAQILKSRGINFKICVAGAGIQSLGASHYEKIFTDAVVTNNLQDQFKFLGRLDHDQMPLVYQQADVTIIPSLFSEGTSLSCLESMACKTPVIASNVGGLNDLIIHGYNGLLTSPTAQDFAQKLVELTQDPALREKISNEAYGLVTNLYKYADWQKKVSNYFS